MWTKSAKRLAHAAVAAVPVPGHPSVSTVLPAIVQEKLQRLPVGFLNMDILKAVEIGDGTVAKVHGDSRLQAAAQHYFTTSGKMIRPKVLLTLAHLCNASRARDQFGKNARFRAEILPAQYTVCCVAEMIHGATLLHDDVIDQADARRSRPTAYKAFGSKTAILSGDYVLARAIKLLCTVGDIRVVRMMSQVLEDLVSGELQQMADAETTVCDRVDDADFDKYMLKTYRKTGSLFAHGAKAVAHLAFLESDGSVGEAAGNYVDAAFEFGKNVGVAFQLIDDVLDFAGDDGRTGKPVGVDLKLGVITAPALFAMRSSAELRRLAADRFRRPGDLRRAADIVRERAGTSETRRLARAHCRKAVQSAKLLCGADDYTTEEDGLTPLERLLEEIINRSN